MIRLLEIGLELDPHPARLDIGVGSFQSDPSPLAQDVPLPATPGDRPTLVQEKPISRIGVLRGSWPHHPTETERNPTQGAPVGNDDQCLSVTPPGRTEKPHI